MAELQEIAEMDYEEAVEALQDKVTEILSGLTSPELSAKAEKYFQAVAKAYGEDEDEDEDETIIEYLGEAFEEGLQSITRNYM